MKLIRNVVLVILAIGLIASIFSGCRSKPQSMESGKKGGKVKALSHAEMKKMKQDMANLPPKR